MSTLTSSAVDGRKVAPRAPPRRRAAPKSAQQDTSPLQTNGAADRQLAEQPSQLESVQTAQTDHVGLAPARGLPAPPVTVERQIEVPQIESQNQQSAVDNASASTDDIRIDDSLSQQTRKRAAEAERSRPAAKRVRIERQPRTITANVQQRQDGPEIDHDDRSGDSASQTSNHRTRASARTSASNAPVEATTTSAQAAAEATTTSAQHTNGAKNNASRPTRAPRVRQQDCAIDPAITGEQDVQLSAGQVADALAAQLHPESEQIRAPVKPRRPRQRKSAKASTGNEATTTSQAGTSAPAEEPTSDHDSDEEHQIDPSTLSMFDLSYDSKHGKTSEREKKMSKIDWAEVARKRREEADAIMKGDLQPETEGQTAIVTSTEGEDGIAQVTTPDQDGAEQTPGLSNVTPTRPEPITRASGAGVRFRLVGGQLVEDEASLTIDRAARVVQAADSADQPIEEENDLTVRFNRATYINARRRDPTERVPLWRSKADAWTEEETDRFYDALRMFGTDFFIISKMFQPRSRKQIKLKFVREERLEPDRVNAALLGRHSRAIDLDHYAQAINRDVADFHKYESLDHANEVIRASMKDKEEAMRAAVKEDEENNRQREAQRQQREKQRAEAEKKKEERAKKKAMTRRGEVWASGTLGGADDHDEFQDD